MPTLPSSRTPPPQEQLRLFQPRPKRLRWTSLPPAVRRQTVELLTQLLLDHRMQRLPNAVTQEVCDE